MDTVYTDYFQKSKVFLYPLLKLRKGMAYVPIQTYICMEQSYTINDCMFICEYHVKSSDKFIAFYERYLKNHKYFNKYMYQGKNYHLFIFDLKDHKKDFDRFIQGKYSQFSLESKLAILDFYISSGNMMQYMHSYLSPEFAHVDYAKALNIDVDIIKEVHEVCSIPNIEKETLNKKNETLNCFLTKNSLYLEKL